MGALVVHGVGGLVVTAYFWLASQVAGWTFFGVEPSPSAARQADSLAAATSLGLLVCIGSVFAVAAAQRSFRDRWGDRLLSWSGWLAAGWLAGGVVGRLMVPLLSNQSKPLGFGVIWLVVGAVASPAALVVFQVRRGPVDPPVAWPVDQSPH